MTLTLPRCHGQPSSYARRRLPAIEARLKEPFADDTSVRVSVVSGPTRGAPLTALRSSAIPVSLTAHSGSVCLQLGTNMPCCVAGTLLVPRQQGACAAYYFRAMLASRQARTIEVASLQQSSNIGSLHTLAGWICALQVVMSKLARRQWACVCSGRTLKARRPHAHLLSRA